MNDETQETTQESTEETTSQETTSQETATTPTSSTQQSSTTEQVAEGEEDSSEETSSEEEGEFEPITADFILENVELPEGYEFIKDDPLMAEFVGILNEKDLTVEDLGPRLVSLYAKGMQANSERWLKTQEDWQKELINDPDIGGDKLDPALEKIDVLIRDYASSFGEDAAKVDEELRHHFDFTGAGNNPNIVRFLHWIARQSGEGAPLSGGSTGGERSRAERMFGT